MSFVEFALDSRQLRQWRKDMETAYLNAAVDAVRETTREGEKALEAAFEGAGLGKLSKAWASEIFPRRGRAYEPAGVIFGKGRDRTDGALKAYTQGARITGKEGNWLAIPTPEAGPRRFGRAKSSITPAEWEKKTGIKLRYVKPPGLAGKALLVADKVVRGKNGRGVRKATARRLKTGRDVESLVIFVLVPQVTVTRRVNTDAVLAPYAGKLKSTFLEKVRALGDQS